MQRFLVAIFLTVAACLVGCAPEPVLELPDWQWEGEGHRRLVTLPVHLDDDLHRLPTSYGLRRQVELPETMRGKGLTLAIPSLQARAELLVDGEPAKFLDAVEADDYRVALPHRYWIRPELTRTETLNLELAVDVRAPCGAWLDTVPRLSATPLGDRSTLWLRAWNLGSSYLTLGLQVSGMVVTGCLALWMRSGRFFGLFLMTILCSTIPASEGLGLLQRLVGTADHFVFGWSLTSTVLILSWLVAVSVGAQVSVLPLVVLSGAQAIVTYPLSMSLAHVRWILPISLPIVALGLVWTLRPTLALLAVRPAPLPHGRWTRALIAFGGSLIGPDLLATAGWWSPLGAWRTGPAGCVVAVVGFAVALAMEAFHTHQRVAGLQQSLEERVLLLESRTREVQALNVELQRQLSSNASELATMLAKASASLGPPLLEVGALVDGRYRIKRPLGQGGMGAVFEALRLADGSRFAIKVIASHYGPKAIARLAREAESALKVNSPHVVAMRDIGTTSDGHLFIAMDLVEGNSLADELGRFGDRTWCLSVLRQVAQGLAAIHQAGVVHRDIKPRNILVSYMTDPLVPEIKITDFGLATLNYESLTDTQTDGASPSLTRTGSVLGTPGYMAPEAYDGAKDLGPSSDIFSFGILAREILQPTRGEPAFPMGLLLQVNPDTPVDSISKHCDFLSDSLVRLLDACTDPAPEKRPSAEDLLRAFEQESSIAPPRA